MRRIAFFIVLAIILVSCSSPETVSEQVATAKQYLEEKGYTVVSLVSESSGELKAEWVNSFPGGQEWAVQQVEPDAYIGEIITRVRFVVKDHPLQDRLEGDIHVTVFVHETEVIGGISFGVDYDGGPYALDGTDAENLGLTSDTNANTAVEPYPEHAE